MNVARSVERFLEQTIDRVSGKVFPGSLQLGTLATRLVREAELAGRSTPLGPVIPNVFEVGLHPDDLPGDDLPLPVLERALAAALEDAGAARGWRFPGPVSVRLNHHDTATPGTADVGTSIESGDRQPWGSLSGASGRHPIANNRVVIGRSPDADITLPDDTVSRKHALLWREDGVVRVRDLGSSNGTTRNGMPVVGDVTVGVGDVLSFGETTTRLDVLA
ncbi:MAG: DUF3662 domain-containing protein [Acidimicrobiia bacterium]|nr:DUF3662 domain-containing protein [Acidimicrobiia bacterium]